MPVYGLLQASRDRAGTSKTVTWYPGYLLVPRIQGTSLTTTLVIPYLLGTRLKLTDVHVRHLSTTTYPVYEVSVRVGSQDGPYLPGGALYGHICPYDPYIAPFRP